MLFGALGDGVLGSVADMDSTTVGLMPVCVMVREADNVLEQDGRSLPDLESDCEGDGVNVTSCDELTVGDGVTCSWMLQLAEADVVTVAAIDGVGSVDVGVGGGVIVGDHVRRAVVDAVMDFTLVEVSETERAALHVGVSRSVSEAVTVMDRDIVSHMLVGL